MATIPDDVKEKIHQFAHSVSQIEGRRQALIQGGEFGYGLAAQELERLKELIKEAFNTGYNRGYMDCRDKVENQIPPFEQFAKDNNISITKK